MNETKFIKAMMISGLLVVGSAWIYALVIAYLGYPARDSIVWAISITLWVIVLKLLIIPADED